MLTMPFKCFRVQSQSQDIKIEAKFPPKTLDYEGQFHIKTTDFSSVSVLLMLKPKTNDLRLIKAILITYLIFLNSNFLVLHRLICKSTSNTKYFLDFPVEKYRKTIL